MRAGVAVETAVVAMFTSTLHAPAGTVMAAGGAAAALSEVSVTVTPPAGAKSFSSNVTDTVLPLLTVPEVGKKPPSIGSMRSVLRSVAADPVAVSTGVAVSVTVLVVIG